MFQLDKNAQIRRIGQMGFQRPPGTQVVMRITPLNADGMDAGASASYTFSADDQVSFLTIWRTAFSKQNTDMPQKMGIYDFRISTDSPLRFGFVYDDNVTPTSLHSLSAHSNIVPAVDMLHLSDIG